MERRSNTKFKQPKGKSGAPFAGMFGLNQPGIKSIGLKKVHERLHNNMDNSDSNNNNKNVEESVKAVTPVKPGKAPVSKKEE